MALARQPRGWQPRPRLEDRCRRILGSFDGATWVRVWVRVGRRLAEGRRNSRKARGGACRSELCLGSLLCEFAERRKIYTEYVHFWQVFGIRWNTYVFHTPLKPSILGHLTDSQGAQDLKSAGKRGVVGLLRSSMLQLWSGIKKPLH